MTAAEDMAKKMFSRTMACCLASRLCLVCRIMTMVRREVGKLVVWEIRLDNRF